MNSSLYVLTGRSSHSPAQGLYGFILFGSNYFAPALAGFIYEGVGWQWTMFIAAFLSVGAFAFLLVFQEEVSAINTSVFAARH